MKKNTLLVTLSLLLSTQTFADPKSIYGEQGLEKVETAQDTQVNSLSNGVCRVADVNGEGCCTGFFIAENLVMTNYHCLSCAHPQASDDPSMDNYFIRIANARSQTQLPLTTNDLDKINLSPEKFSSITMEIKTEAESLSFQNQDIKIKKLLAGNKGLDFLVMEVERPRNKNIRVLQLSDMRLSVTQELITIGYPGSSPFPGQKVYDKTEECRVSESYIMHIGGRYDNFGHQCDTNPGSSGSPMFDRLTGRVVGLHWAGGARRKSHKKLQQPPFLIPAPILQPPALRPIQLPSFGVGEVQAQESALNSDDEDYKNTQNKAVLMSAIISFLKANNPEIYEKLNIQ